MADIVQISVLPSTQGRWVEQAVESGGGVLAPLDKAQVLIWTGSSAPELKAILTRSLDIRWVQLPAAGIEQYLELMGDGRIWTSAKGIYSEQVAEHALALALAGRRQLVSYARAQSWQDPADGSTLYANDVTILGGGGIARALIGLLTPFRARITIVRRRPEAIPGARQVVGPEHLHDALGGADLLVLALALTPETEGIIGRQELLLMKPDAWIVNVARGKHIVTDDLVAALEQGWIGGAALDVTAPEPLPSGHPLWTLDNCLVTPHSANPPHLFRASFTRRIEENVRRYRSGRPLLGLVDEGAGY